MLELKKVSEKQEKRSHICLPCDPICIPNIVVCEPYYIIDPEL